MYNYLVYGSTGEDKEILAVCETEDMAKRGVAYYKHDYPNAYYSQCDFDRFPEMGTHIAGEMVIELRQPDPKKQIYVMKDCYTSVEQKYYNVEDYGGDCNYKENFSFNMKTRYFAEKKLTTLNITIATKEEVDIDNLKKFKEWVRDKINEKAGGDFIILVPYSETNPYGLFKDEPI